VDVRYGIYPDKGYGFTNRDNEIKAYKEVAEFLASKLC